MAGLDHPSSRSPRSETGPPRASAGLYTIWERSTKRIASGFAFLTLVVLGLLSAALRPAQVAWWALIPVPIAGASGVYWAMTRVIRQRRSYLREPFPQEWEAVLQRDVAFFRALEPAERDRFRRQLLVFLREKRITGVRTDVDTTTLVLVGASATIPAFGFTEWEWDQISEVLIYPARFDEHYSFDAGEDRDTLGMVGTGAMNRVMILVKPDLIRGYRDSKGKHNVGVHEFAHLLDKSDGELDGSPFVGLDRQATGPWIELVRRKMAEIEKGRSDIDGYALTDESEFFAVASEYFFTRPEVMKRKHPDLYAALQRVFQQDPVARIRSAAQRNGAADQRREGGKAPPLPSQTSSR